MADVGVAAPSFVSQAPKLGFVGGFDGVRGIGIMLVLAQHAYPLLFPSVAGIIDVFFVMSAFLIVSLLLQEHRSLHDINMRRFYARRALRLLPSAYLCLLAWVVVSLLFDRDRLVWVLQDAAAAVTYVYNLVFPVGIEAVDPQAASQRSIDQFWSLAVEEQFYLMVAVTVLVCIRKRWITQLAVVMVAIATYIGLARLFGQTGPWPGGPTNSSVPARGLSLLWLSRPDSLMWGVALAVLNARLPDPLPEKWRVWLPRAGAVGLVVAGTTMLLGSPFLHDLASRANVPHLFFPMAPHDGVDDGALYWIKFGHTLTALACMPALLAMVRTKDWWGNRGLSWKPLRFLGRMSYTLYVWHTLVYFLVLHVLGGNDVLGQKWRVPILMVLAVVACLPVFFWVEQPLMRAKLRFASEKEVVDLNTGKVIHVDDLRAASVDGARGRPPVTVLDAPRPFTTRAPKLGLVGGFDGIRGIGVCMVLVGHALFEYVESWVTIVDTFFVLSGFLITTLLLQEVRTTGTISLKKFYLRRATRLLPSVWLFATVWILISLVATAVGFEPLHLRNVGADALAAVAYVYHVVFPNGLYVIEPAVQSERTMWHLWTLGVEEWFYIVIAGTVLICARRRWVLQLGVAMVAIFVAIGLARWFAFTGFFQDDEGMIPGVRMAFLQRPDALGLGVAMAAFNAYVTEEHAQRWRRPVLWACNLALVVWLVMLNLSSGLVRKLGGPYLDYLPSGPSQFSRPQMLDNLYWFRFGHTIGALAFAFILVGLVRYRDWWLARWWSWQPFQWMGRLSYTLYVWHALPFIILMAVIGGDDPSLGVQLLRTPILIAAAFLVSMPVYYLVELPVLRMKLRFSAEPEALDLTTGKMVPTGEAAEGDGAAPAPGRDGAPGEPGAPTG